jgi:hypothetical protein
VLRLPLPLADAALRDLAVEPIVPPDLDADVRIAPGRLDVCGATPAVGTATVGARLTFTAYPWAPDPRPVALAEGDRDFYTRPAEGLVRIDAGVRALAAHLAGAEPDAFAVVRRFWNHILDHLTCGIVDYATPPDTTPLDRVLSSGWFDCQLGASLLVALCRSQAIPARVVSGYLLYPSSPSYHWWAEAWLSGRGWVPFDTFSSDLSARGRDALWRDGFFGQLDYRMKSEVLPRLFNRSPGLHMPPDWRILRRIDGEATEVALVNCASGRPVYRDRIVVRVAS